MRAPLLLLCCVLAGCAAEQTRPGPPGSGRHGDAPGPRRGDGAGRGPLFASPMGEPFHGPDGERRWFDGADANSDGALVVAELETDALRFHATLDQGKDGEIDPDDLQRYETILFPELRVAGSDGGPRGRNGSAGQGRGKRGGGMGDGGIGRGRGGGGDRSGADASGRATASTAGRQGAGRFSYLNLPEPVTAADSNFNRGVSASEFTAAARTRFSQLDTNGDGKLTLAELPSIRRGPPSGGANNRPSS